MQSLIEHGLEQTASLWPDIERAYKWIHQAAHILNNHEDEDAARVQRRFNGMVGAMARHRDCAGSLHDAIDHFGKVTRSYRERWKELRQRLDRRRQARTQRTRFRRDPAAYLAELEEKSRQLILPA